MTSQPDFPATDRIGIDEDEEAAQDPDLVIVAGEVIEDDDAEPDTTETETGAGHDLTGSGLTGSDRDEYAAPGGPDIVAAATSTTALTDAHPCADLADGLQKTTGLSDGRNLEGDVRPADLGQEWHDIQAMFVDDPRGSVELAAAAADAAVSALVETLHQRQTALAPAGSTPADPGGTEQLREALRSYRIFCQSLTEIGQGFAQRAAMTPVTLTTQ